MSGDAKNIEIWSGADVFVAPLGTALPASESAPFPADWAQVGYLDGGDGFEYSRSEDTKDLTAWGAGVVKVSRKNHKSMYKFSALEDNPVTRALVWPGSTSSELKVPVVVDQMIAFETTSGGKIKRRISRNYAQVELNGSIKDGEEDLSKRTFDVTVFPDANNVLFDQQAAPDIASIAITPLTLALSLAGKIIGKLVATATYTNATTGDITAKANWITSAPTKATVSAGYVTAVATGTANISVTFGGVTSTAPSVVTVSA